MSLLAQKTVIKMNGLGNEIVILDLRGSDLSVVASEVRAIGRGEGLHFDQLMVLFDPRSEGTDAFMKIYNIDGSEAGACGNGTRCVAWMLMRDGTRDRLVLETAMGGLLSIDMGQPRLAWNEIPLSYPIQDTASVVLDIPVQSDLPPATLVNMGNPHAVFFLDPDQEPDLEKLGPMLEHHPIFPDRANISFARIIAPDNIILNVWERGAGITQACGSAACATLVAAVLRGLSARAARIALPGGNLHIVWHEADGKVEMTGPVAFEYDKTLDPLLFSGVDA
jgi:diaminopimelate epimerase